MEEKEVGVFSSNPMCEVCGGACCESITLDCSPFAISGDFMRFLEFRSVPQIREIDGKRNTNMRMFEAKCLMLQGGRCAVYSCRPEICKCFEPGGDACRITVASKRNADQIQAIFGSVQKIQK